jgi:hypothetical protein
MNRILFLVAAIATFGVCALAQPNNPGCPDIDIAVPGLAMADDAVTLSARITGIEKSQNLSFNWWVSAGKITSGQGTPEIKYAASSDEYRERIDVNVDVTGLPKGCPTYASGSTIIQTVSDGGRHSAVTIGNANEEDTLVQLDLLFANIQNNPGIEGVIEFIFDRNENRSRKVARISFVLKHIDFRQIARDRFTLAISNGDSSEILLWSISRGGELPNSERYFKSHGQDPRRLVKAEEFESEIKKIFQEK